MVPSDDSMSCEKLIYRTTSYITYIIKYIKKVWCKRYFCEFDEA